VVTTGFKESPSRRHRELVEKRGGDVFYFAKRKKDLLEDSIKVRIYERQLEERAQRLESESNRMVLP